MSLLLYAIVEGEPRALAQSGLGGHPLRTVARGELTAVVGQPPNHLEPDKDTLRDYARIVEGLMRRAVVLPARFGSRVDDEEGMRALLDDRQAEFRAAIEAVRGAVELGVRIEWMEPAAPAGTPLSGTQDPGRQLERHHRARALAAAMDQALHGQTREQLYRILLDPTAAVDAAFLVDRERVGRFLAAAQRLAASLEQARITWTGPLPPYSFISPETVVTAASRHPS